MVIVVCMPFETISHFVHSPVFTTFPNKVLCSFLSRR